MMTLCGLWPGWKGSEQACVLQNMAERESASTLPSQSGNVFVFCILSMTYNTINTLRSIAIPLNPDTIREYIRI
jgi:hypothetical protein